MDPDLILPFGGLLVTIVGVAMKVGRQVNRVEEALKAMSQVAAETHDLHDWYDMSDAEGVKIWYVRKSLETALKDLTGAVNRMSKHDAEQTQLLREIASKMGET